MSIGRIAVPAGPNMDACIFKLLFYGPTYIVKAQSDLPTIQQMQNTLCNLHIKIASSHQLTLSTNELISNEIIF